MAEIKERQKHYVANTRAIAKRIFRHENAVLAIVLVVITATLGVMTRGSSVSPYNVKNVAFQSSIRGLASIGQAFVILTAGIDLSVGGVALMSSMIGATLMRDTTPFPVGPIAIMLLFATAAGALNGSLVSRIGMPSLIVTLGMWQITNGASFQFGHGISIGNLPRGLAFFGQGEIAGIPVAVIIFIVVAVIGYIVLNYTTYGRSVYATGGSPVSAWLSGITVKNTLFSVFVIAGFTAGLAGLMQMARSMSAAMTNLIGLELDSIASVVMGGVSLFGGRGTLIGVIIGVFIIGVINNGMNLLMISPAFQSIVKGAIIISAVGIDCLRRR